MENTPNLEIEEAKKQAQHFGIDFVSLRGMDIADDVLNIIPEDVARRYQMVVYKKDGKHLFIAIADPNNLRQKAPDILTTLKKEQGYTFTICLTTKNDVYYALLGYKQKNVTSKQSMADENNEQINKSEQNIPNIVNSKLPSIDLIKLKTIQKDTIEKFPKNIASKYRIIVFDKDTDNKKIKVALDDPDNLQTQEILNFISNRNHIDIEQYQTSSKDIDWAITQYDKKPEAIIENRPENKPAVVESPVKQDMPKINTVNSDMQAKYNSQVNNTKPENIAPVVKPEPNKQDEEIAPNIKTTEITASDAKPVSNNETSVMATSEETQNLDSVLPDKVENINQLVQIVKSGSIPQIVAAMIYLAVKLEASDIHLEADAKELKLRYRLDGILKDIVTMPVTLQSPIVSRIKILSKLKIDEQRVPQDGRFDVVAMGKSVDLRISTLPTIHGEKCVMRLLDKTVGLIGLDKLGLVGENLKRTQLALEKPYGIIFVTGPTGSGKTTTLYAMLNKLNTQDVNIVTLEDPVEYELSGINQCQIKPKIGFGFADGLRSILRQDPNIIMVGEVRDAETANMATHAALTGHLVLSTLHTNDASGALPRLIDMGVEPYLITSSINAIIAQRLVRKLCDKCKEEVQIPPQLKTQIITELNQCQDPEIRKMATEDIKFYKPKGCPDCKDGYKGRVGLYEVLTMTDRIEQLAVNRSTSSIIKRAALNQGLVTMQQDGYAKAARGVTSIDEVIRVTSK